MSAIFSNTTRVLSVVALATSLFTGMEAIATPASSSALTLDPAQRKVIAATAENRATLRRSRVARTPNSTGVPLSVEQLQRALSMPSKPRDRQTEKRGLISEIQQHAIRTLNATTQNVGGIQAHFDERNGTLAFLKPQGKMFTISPRALALATHDASVVAKQFLVEQRDLLKLDDPDAETRVIQQSNDARDRTHVRLQQVYKDVPLWGKELLVHTKSTTGVYLVQGNYEPTPRQLDTIPSIRAEQAMAAVRGDLQASADTPIQSDLVIYTPDNGDPLLAYKIDIAPGLDARWIYFIDARDGTIVHRIHNIHANTVSASGADLHGVTRTFNAWSQGGRFYLIDPSTPTVDAVYDPITNGPNPSGDTFVYTAQNGSDKSLPQFYNTSTAQNAGWDAAAVSAAYNTRVVYDYYKNTFGRDSFDGKGMNLMVAIHYKKGFNNAFWNGTFMVYGDGDDQTFTSLAGCLDVAAHEMTHGVIEHSAHLVYENQSGALNESFADIFAAMVDKDDWLLGEDCTVPQPGFLRNMKNPGQSLHAQPAKMSEYQNLPNTKDTDNGGVHVNSGIPNRAAYLVAEGLSTESLGTSIGRAKTEQIFYRALTVYLTASARFSDARRATIQSADDLYGESSPEVVAVTAAWDAVEVKDAGAVPAPTSTDALQGNDVMVYLYPQDGVSTDPSEPFDIHMQVLDRPFKGFNSKKNFGPLNSIAAAYTRPAVYTNAIGTWILYVGVDNNLYLHSPINTTTAITKTGGIFSVAASPNGRYFAYVSTFVGDNTVTVIDLVTPSNSRAFRLNAANSQAGSDGVETILYADALAFDYSSRYIIFDALNCISTPTSDCTSTSGGYRYWSIGQLSFTNGQLFFPFPNQNPLIDLGNPSFAANNQSVIALDFIDRSKASATDGIVSSVVTFNLETQELKTIYTFKDTTQVHVGRPSFWGDDDYLTFQIPNTANGRVAVRIGVDSSWDSTGLPESLNPNAIAIPVMHRASERILTGQLTVDASLLDFGSVIIGTSKSITLMLRNPGNNDVNITGITLDGAAFRSDATNTRVPRGTNIPIAVSFASAITGTQTGALTVTSDGTTSTLVVSLVGTVTAQPQPAPPSSSSGHGGGGTLDIWSLAVIAVAARIIRQKKSQRNAGCLGHGQTYGYSATRQGRLFQRVRIPSQQVRPTTG